MNPRTVPHRLRSARSQRGTMLIIALIVLVAMTLAGISTMRSVDTATLVAGNLAFKQSTVNGADEGLQAAFAWLNANAGKTVLYNSDTAAGYISNAPATEPDWSNPNTWTNAFALNGGSTDAAGNKVYFLIHRMCLVANCAPNSTCSSNVNLCGATPDNTATSSEGTEQGAANFFVRPPAIHYRITARAVGPRNSITIVQTMLRSI
jgi:type IV pilus assembly protein PilX